MSEQPRDHQIAARLSTTENDLLMLGRAIRDMSIRADRDGAHGHAKFYDEVAHAIDWAANEVARAYNTLVNGNEVVPSIREDL